MASRLALARSFGADHTAEALPNGEGASEVASEVGALTGGRGADVCIELSVSYAALHGAVRSVAPGGRVVAAGFYQGEGVRLEKWDFAAAGHDTGVLRHVLPTPAALRTAALSDRGPRRLEPGAGHLDWPPLLAALSGRYAGELAYECRLSGRAEDVLQTSASFLRRAAQGAYR